MMTARWIATAVAAGLFAAADAPGLQVTTVARDGRVQVTCAVSGGLPADMDEALRSGLMTTFTYDVELRRSVSVWVDRSLASAAVIASAQLDTLTGRFQVSRSVDGRIEDSRVSADRADVTKFLTTFERLPLFTTGDLEPNVEYVVRVRLRTRPRVNWFFWPFNRSDAAGFARFALIP
jgi:hypothetical protein